MMVVSTCTATSQITVNLIDPQGTQGRLGPRLGGIPWRLNSPSVPQRPSNDIQKTALQKIGDATGSRLDKDWRLWPGDKSFLDGLGNLRKMGFKPFFNPGHWGGSDWEGQIDGNWYHVIVGYPSPSAPTGRYFGSPCDRPPSFVDAHYERNQPSSLRHLRDYLFGS